MDGDNYSFDLSMTPDFLNFWIEANELSLYANNNATIESNGNLNLLANENLTGWSYEKHRPKKRSRLGFNGDGAENL